MTSYTPHSAPRTASRRDGMAEAFAGGSFADDTFTYEADPAETGAVSQTARAMEAMALYGAPKRPVHEDPIDPARDFETHARGLIGCIGDMLEDCALETYVEDIAWGLINTVHRRIERLGREIDGHQLKAGELAREQDGSEVKACNLEEAVATAEALEHHQDVLGTIKDAMGAAFRELTGSTWKPASGSRRRGKYVNAAMVAAKDFERARELKVVHDYALRGTLIGFGGGPDYDNYERVWALLDKCHAKHPDMVLVHGGQNRGAEKHASAWADARGVDQVTFTPNFAAHRKAAPFKRNEQMVRSGFKNLIVFPGNGITANLAQRAEEAGVRVHRYTA